jgi:hypothetical protein
LAYNGKSVVGVIVIAPVAQGKITDVTNTISK